MRAMTVLPIPCLRDNYAWLLRCETSGESALIDACEPAVVPEVARRVGPGRLTAVWSTHHHFDHVGGNISMVEGFPGIEVLAHVHDRERIPGLTRALEDGANMTLGTLEVTIWHIPGHTLGAIAYVVRGGGEVAVFTGDTLFGAGCGRLFEGTPAMMHTSLMRLMTLPKDTRVYCGHEYTAANLAFARHLEPDEPAIAERQARVAEQRAGGQPSLPSTIGEELQTNPFVRAGSPALRATLGLESASDLAVFTAARKLKDGFRG